MADGTPVIGTGLPSADDNIWYVDGSSLIRPGTASSQDLDLNVSAYPTGNRLVCPSSDSDTGNQGRILATENYRTTQPSLRISAATGTSVVVTAAERVYAAGGGGFTRTGIAEISDLFGTPSVNVVATSGVAVGRIGMDRQTRSLVAALNSTKTTVYLWDGATETTIDTSTISTTIVDYVEPIQ
jgi:hypothetical protein